MSTPAPSAAPLRIAPRGTRPALDLGRDVQALLGLVFDATTVEAAAAHLRHCAATGTRCVIATPNVNFAMAARRDAAFRDSVLQSDLSLADGAPLVRLARLLGLPLRERVAGSDVFDRLHQGDATRPIKVFFFGGDDGVAQRAAAALNAQRGGLVCVGHCSPGFGSVEAMSSDALLASINASGADFVVVSLGAKKGQAWIQHNRERLSAPLLCHLGAVVNFVAGTVRRAPPWTRRLGLEWLWRIKEEPALWRRYSSDAWALLGTLAASLPSRIASARPLREPAAAASLRSHVEGRVASFTLAGVWTRADLPRLRRALAEALHRGSDVQLDLSELQDADTALLALIALLDRWQLQPRAIAPASRISPRVGARVATSGLGYLIDHLAHHNNSP